MYSKKMIYLVKYMSTPNTLKLVNFEIPVSISGDTILVGALMKTATKLQLRMELHVSSDNSTVNSGSSLVYLKKMDLF